MFEIENKMVVDAAWDDDDLTEEEEQAEEDAYMDYADWLCDARKNGDDV